jgi:peroxiredoxin
LKYKSEMVLGDLDLHVGNYEFSAGGKEVGPLTRVTSLAQDRKTGNLDVFVRYDDKGNVMGISNIVGLDETFGTSLISHFFTGKDPRQYKDALTILVNGLSMGARTVDPSVKKEEKVYSLQVKQKSLAPGDKLPGLKAKDIDGKDFDTAQFKDRPMIMVFASADCLRCDDMMRAVEKGVSGGGKIATVYIVSADASVTRSAMERTGAKGTAVSEPADYAARVFQVPYKPYIFMFDRGVLKYASPWNGEADLGGQIQGLKGGKK